MKTTACIILMSLASALFNWTSKDSMERVMDKYKSEFRTYDYTGYANHQVKDKTVCMEFTAFRGVSYKLLFCSAIAGVPVAINVYDKDAKSVNRKKIFDNSHNVSGSHWVFEPRCSGTYYIEYSVPSSCNKKANVVLLIGSDTNAEDFNGLAFGGAGAAPGFYIPSQIAD